MKVAILTTDNREHLKDYSATVPYFGTAPEALLQGLTKLSDLEVHVVSCTQKPMRSPEKLGTNAWFHSLHVPKIGWLKTLYQGCVRAVRHKLAEIRPDVVHGHGTERDCAISAVLSGFPNLVTIHGNMRLIAQVNRPVIFSYLWISVYLERFTIPRSHGVICISRYTQHAVQDLARKTWVVPNAVAEDFFGTPRQAQTEPIIVCVGHVILRKNQIGLIRALDPLSVSLPFRLVFIGQASRDDAYAAEFLELISSRPWCEYVGAADRETVKKWLGRVRFVIAPSLEENCPMVVLEAMAAGVPVLAANVGGIPELIESNVTGLLFDPTDLQSIRTAVQTALEKPSRLESMAATAKQHALHRHHPRVIALQHLEIYREILYDGMNLTTAGSTAASPDV